MRPKCRRWLPNAARWRLRMVYWRQMETVVVATRIETGVRSVGLVFVAVWSYCYVNHDSGFAHSR
jgi:hypothetical protein